MASQTRIRMIIRMLKGIVTALIVTAAAMLLLALAVVFIGLPDAALTALNQLVKVLSIFLGVWMSVGRGGERGFVLGAVIGLCYMVVSYALYCMLDQIPVTVGLLASEFAMGAGLGALSGALIANLTPGKKVKRRTSAASA